MNIYSVIIDNIKDIEERQRELSLILQSTLRISLMLENIDGILWQKLEMINVSNKNELDEFQKDMTRLLSSNGYSRDEINNKYSKIMEEYFTRRSVDIVNEKGAKKVEYGLPLIEIENRIDFLKEQIDRNQIPEGLHSLDLFFKYEEKRKLDMMLIQQKEGYENILDRIQSKLYSFLINLEKENQKSDEKQILKAPLSNNIFIIHGHDEAKWRELEKLLKEQFNLNPLVLQECPDRGAQTILEKFLHYAETCSYAFAIFTPDDIVENNGKLYFQTRPNVIFEIGWFCAYLGRRRICILAQDSNEMNIFSDFQGVIQKRFFQNVSELQRDLHLELKDIGLI